jgi:tetratricopeptide (TPR) repeat protein
VREHPQDPRYHSALGIAYAYLDLKDDAAREGKHATELYPVSKDALDGPNYVFNLAQIYTLVGEHEKAIDQLEYLLFIPSGSLLSVQTLRLDPRWDSLRSHPRFQQLLKKYSNSD